MFNEPGSKIKTFSIIIFIISVIAIFVYNLIIFNEADGLLELLLIIGAGIVEILASWIACLFIYSYGQLVENSDIIAENMYKLETRSIFDNYKK
ncbi:MAG: hypothetical protein IJN63_06535 [Clostridia bacterium]|nr:hypothetical protein [Clostridia bacterium]